MSEIATHGFGVWRRGDILIYARGGSLPRRCPKCNGAAVVLRRIDLKWGGGASHYNLLSRVAPKDRIAIKTALCRRHDRRWRWRLYLGPLMIGLATIMPLTGVLLSWWLESAAPFSLMLNGAVLLFIAWILFRILQKPLLIPVYMDKDFVMLSGCSDEFLQTLPEEEAAEIGKPDGELTIEDEDQADSVLHGSE